MDGSGLSVFPNDCSADGLLDRKAANTFQIDAANLLRMFEIYDLSFIIAFPNSSSKRIT